MKVDEVFKSCEEPDSNKVLVTVLHDTPINDDVCAFLEQMNEESFTKNAKSNLTVINIVDGNNAQTILDRIRCSEKEAINYNGEE